MRDPMLIPPIPTQLSDAEYAGLKSIALDLVLGPAQELDPGPLRTWLLEVAEALLAASERGERSEALEVGYHIAGIRSGYIGQGSE